MYKFLSKSHAASSMLATGVTFTLNLVAAVFISVLSISTASAIILNGSVTGGTSGGGFVVLPVPFGIATNPTNTVGDDNFQSPNLYAFNEDQNILLTSPLSVDVGVGNVTTGATIASGQTVASHYVFFDPAIFSSVKGFVDFDAPIIGIATETGTLGASDILQNSLVDYQNPGLRGLESGDSALISSTNIFRLLIDFTANSPGDYVRVFTQFSPGGSVVPLPAALPLYGTGLAIMGFIGWRRKQRKAVV